VEEKEMKRLMLVVMALFVLAACGATPAAPAADDAGTTKILRIGYVPVMIYAPLYVGIERGYFAAEGITIESTPVQGGSDPVVQLAAGNFDVALGGAGAGLFNAAARGVKFSIVAPMHSEKAPLTSPLVISAKRVDEITKIADLKGKKVAINATGAATEYWLSEALGQGGLRVEDVELVTVPFKDVPAALASNSIDAAILGEPLATIASDKGEVALLSNDFINGFFATYLYMGEPLLNDKATAQAFMRAYLKACGDLQGDYMSPEIATIIEKYTKVPADVVMRASPAQYDASGTIPVANLETLQNYFRKRGVLEYETNLDVNTLINTELVASLN
jgi:NitT/TauT family transport system substrate-binding protein